MIPLHEPLASWRMILRKNFTQIHVFTDFLQLSEEQKTRVNFNPTFRLNVPLRLAQKMQKGTLDDPLVKQFLPLIDENLEEPGFVLDPVGDACSRVGPKLLHKYEGRVLLVTTSACAMHCRYCFRQNFGYETRDKVFQEELAIIKLDSSIHEVILSGGDPLSLSDQLLASLLNQLDQIDHIRRIRFHTRFPIGIPERIDENFLSIIKKLNKQIFFVVHINHPLEIDEDVLFHLKSLQKAGCIILNQAVLLNGVNDDLLILKQLCEQLADNGILPYYIHQLDRVIGSQHFEVQVQKGKYLIEELSKVLPGYAVPKYVREISGEMSKTPI